MRVPESVSPRQIRQALSAAGLRDTVEAAEARYTELVTSAQNAGWLALGAAVSESLKPRQEERVAV